LIMIRKMVNTLLTALTLCVLVVTTATAGIWSSTTEALSNWCLNNNQPHLRYMTVYQLDLVATSAATAVYFFTPELYNGGLAGTAVCLGSTVAMAGCAVALPLLYTAFSGHIDSPGRNRFLFSHYTSFASDACALVTMGLYYTGSSEYALVPFQVSTISLLSKIFRFYSEQQNELFLDPKENSERERYWLCRLLAQVLQNARSNAEIPVSRSTQNARNG